MKRTFTSLLFSALAALPLWAQDVVTADNEGAIRSIFSASLEGEEQTLQEDTRIPMDQIASTREKVWDIWKSAVNAYDEDKLIALDILDNRKTGSWTLPSSLEPNAVMPYYWGCNTSEIVPGEKYPMFLYMHGSGDKNQEWANGLGFSRRYFYSPGIYFVPQIPNAYGEYYRWAIQSKQWAWEKLLRLAFITDEIDANKIYFFGISEGAYGSQRLASFYADYLAGAGPMAGGEPLKNAPMENVANIAFSLRTGSEDTSFGRNILTQKALDVADSLERAHPGYYNHFIEVIKGDGHSIDYTPTTPWLARFSRDPHPDYFFWENFDMYGRKRTGFHNLRVIQNSVVSTDVARVCYEMTREDNTVHLNVSKVTYTTTYSQGGIAMYFSKRYASVSRGKVRIYLNEKEYDLSQPVKVVLNGKEIFNGMVGTDLKTMVESCAYFYDPERLFPAAIDVDIRNKSVLPTSIDVIRADAEEQAESLYDLSGRQVTDTKQSGIYISNGRAILVK